MNLEDHIPPRPYLAQNRFWLPIRVYDHAILPLMPCSDVPLNRETRRAWDMPVNATTDDEIEQLDLSPFNVGMHCGKPSDATVLAVTTQSAQEWLDDQELPDTPQWFSRGARYYLFNFKPLPNTVTDIRPGLQLLNDGTFVIYPGSIHEDGHTVYWEICPDCVEVADLPAWLVPFDTLVLLPA